MSNEGLFDADEPNLGLTGRPLRTIPQPPELEKNGPATVISMCNQKGGVGKTTSTINMGACLADYGRKVLLVDLDPQGALSAGLGLNHNDIEDTIYDVMLDSQTSIHSAIVRTDVPGLDLVPANIDLSAAEIQMVNEVGREHTLARALRPVMKDYDFIIIDCQPSLGLLTVNALACSHGVIIPMECEFFSLRGLALLTDTVEKVAERINFDLEVIGILVTMFDRRTKHAREVMSRVVEYFDEKVFDTVITRTVRFPETSVAGEPITTWAPSSQAAKQYRDLAAEVIERTKG
ncbi:chromosome partitioning protein [Corynebacterium stationis]|uniref:ParA family protein n=1 Tax=Corynebacterium stationis TaxID=1705 RepID=A0AB36CM10_9CORY|nr:ParA family protein [Corynebacterium stationis]APT95088.1 chromosome partitioning protein [Corynebacterium stationis]NME89889.1 ParA family protein [Corynebacterium stationis]